MKPVKSWKKCYAGFQMKMASTDREFVSIAESIYCVVLIVTEGHILHTVKELDELFVTFCYSRTELVAVYIEIIKQT